MNDRDIEDMFQSPAAYDDAEAFEQRVMNGLKVKLWLRQGLVVLAGFIGGVYALAQLVRMPNWTVDGKAVYAQSIQKAAADTDETLRAGVELVDVIGRSLTGLLNSTGHYLVYMQTAGFFWVTFFLCMAFVGLYYAYSQEETI